MSLAARLPTTRWSLVIRAAFHTEEPVAREKARQSLGELCQLYWPALYGYLRRRGFNPADAEDLIQGFFADLLQRESLTSADESRGRFRAFLYSSLDHYVSNEYRRANALKRGGGETFTDLERPALENSVPAEASDPSAEFDREWALCLIQQTLTQLRERYRDRDKENWFGVLSAVLTATDSSLIDRQAMAAELGLSATALKVAIHRLRVEFREHLLESVRDTVDDPADCGKERQWLFEAFKPAR